VAAVDAGMSRETPAARPRIAVVVGTRPEAIKMAPVVRALQARSDALETVVVTTAQHREMLDQVFTRFRIAPDVDLDLMRPNQSLTDLTCAVLKEMEQTLAKIRPDLLMVQGDTTTTFAATLAAHYAKVPVAHVEAGLRSHDVHNPFPEEMNRRLTTVLTDIHLAPTPLARRELLREGVPAAQIVVTGNSIVDALAFLLETPCTFHDTPLAAIPFDGHRVLLVTSHRRESWGQELENICLALKELATKFPDTRVVYPVHLNPNVRNMVNRVLNGVERIHLTPPLDYLSFINLMRRAFLILTDSGGVQEEAPTLHKPLLVLRKVTERPEAFHAGLSRVVGTSRERIVEEASRLLTDPAAYRAMAEGENPYGDGRAAERIAEVVCRWSRAERPLLDPAEEFQPQGRA
jgi:UDP-N-acetylglucosamine 2-epimerase (non-hydrolysing)